MNIPDDALIYPPPSGAGENANREKRGCSMPMAANEEDHPPFPLHRYRRTDAEQATGQEADHLALYPDFG